MNQNNLHSIRRTDPQTWRVQRGSDYVGIVGYNPFTDRYQAVKDGRIIAVTTSVTAAVDAMVSQQWETV